MAVTSFQSTLPHGERPVDVRRDGPRTVFQSTLPHGERPRPSNHLHGVSRNFNPRSRMGSDNSRNTTAAGKINFNPRSRMGSDRGRLRPLRLPRISIHAPAWGATGATDVPRNVVHISIHAPAWGATRSTTCITSCGVNFNPRSRMGSDVMPGKASSWSRVFQSTLPHGERPTESAAHAPVVCYFNPRSRMGSDRIVKIGGTLIAYFNPRSRMGSDERLIISVVPCEVISIHAPAWGATVSMAGSLIS